MSVKCWINIRRSEIGIPCTGIRNSICNEIDMTRVLKFEAIVQHLLYLLLKWP